MKFSSLQRPLLKKSKSLFLSSLFCSFKKSNKSKRSNHSFSPHSSALLKRATRAKERRAEKRKSERAKEQKSKRTKEHKSERAKERKSKRSKEQKNKRAKERKSKRAKEQKSERANFQPNLSDWTMPDDSARMSMRRLKSRLLSSKYSSNLISYYLLQQKKLSDIFTQFLFFNLFR